MSKRKEFIKAVGTCIYKIDALKMTSVGKAILTKLRQSVNQPLSRTIIIWPFLFESMSDDLLGTSEQLTGFEKVLLNTCQLFAIHQQGQTDSVLLVDEVEKYKNLGYSLKVLRREQPSTAADRRFNAMITATTYEELLIHLRHLIRLVKSKDTKTKINYVGLAGDLYSFYSGYDEDVRLAWAKEYYRAGSNKEGEKENAK